MIRFRFTADPAESIAFSYSPLLEAVLSLHVVTEPKHHPLQHRWVRKARTLPAGLRRELAAFSFAYSSFVPEFLMPSPATGYHTFEDELQALEHLDEETLALGFLRPLYAHRGERDPRLLEDERVREHVAGRVASIGGDVDLAALMFESPSRLVARFTAFLSDYWEAAFEEEWTSLEPRLADTVVEAGRGIASDGVYVYLTGCHRSFSSSRASRRSAASFRTSTPWSSARRRSSCSSRAPSSGRTCLSIATPPGRRRSCTRRRSLSPRGGRSCRTRRSCTSSGRSQTRRGSGR